MRTACSGNFPFIDDRVLCEYARDPANGLWLDTVEAITRHIHRRRDGVKS